MSTTADGRKVLRLGLVGCGSIARWSHLPALFSEDLKNMIKLVALCDVNDAKMNELGERYNVGRRCKNYNDLIEDPEVDALDLAAGHEMNYQIIPKAAKAGKHVFAEKPLTGSSAEAKKIEKIVNESGIVLQVGFMRRFWWTYRKAKELIDAGEIESLESLNVLFWSGALNDLLNNGIHIFDLVQFFGGPAKEVYAVTKQSTGKDAGSIAVTVSFENNVVGNLFLSSIGLVSNGVRERVELVGSNRKMILCENERRVSLMSPGDASTEYWEPSLIKHWITGSNIAGFAEEFKHFADCIMNKKDSLSGVETGARSILFMEAIKESINRKSVITLGSS